MTAGRRKNKLLLSYNDAKYWVQQELIQSRNQYWKWHDREKPKQLPKYPNRVYAEWTSWNDFLNNDNEFMNANPRQFRPWLEALAYAQASGIKTQKEWFKHDHPDDIPVRPEIVYRGMFLGWRSFLGTGKYEVAHKVAALNQTKDLGILVVDIPQGNPANIIHAFVAKGGKPEVVDTVEKYHIRVLKMFKMEEGYDWRAVMDRNGSTYETDQWIISNVHELLWQFSNDLLFVT